MTAVSAVRGTRTDWIVATLHVLQGPDKGRTLRTSDDIVLIGRGSDQIPLTDQTVSRRHAELRVENGAWVLSDLNSANGTYLNGVRINRPTRLKHGDQIRLGGTLVVFTQYNANGAPGNARGAELELRGTLRDALLEGVQPAALAALGAADPTLSRLCDALQHGALAAQPAIQAGSQLRQGGVRRCLAQHE